MLRPMQTRPPARAALVALLLASTAAQARDPGAPATPTKPVTDTYFGVQVTDPYRWLENTADPAVHAWSVAQDARTRAILDHTPLRATIHARLTKFLSATSPAYRDLTPAGGQVFATIVQPPRQQPFIGIMGPDADPAHIRAVVDPNALDPSGATEIDWWVPSPDGTKIAVSLSRNGSEDGTLHVYDARTGREIGRPIPGVQYPTGGGSLAWRADGRGFYYTRYPGAERPEADRHFFQQVYAHQLGADASADRLVLGAGLPKLAEIALDSRQNPNYVLASVENGDGGQFAHFIIFPDGHVRQVTRFEDRIVGAVIGPDDRLYLTSRRGAPHGKLLVLPVADADLSHAKTLVPEGPDVIRTGGEFEGAPVTVTPHALYIRELAGGPSRLAAYTLDGKALPDVPLPPVAAVGEVAAMPDQTLLYQIQTYLRPPYFDRFDPRTRRASPTALAETSPVHFDDATVTREFATSKDGTRIPVNIIALRGTRLDGANPTLLYGYGGYGISEEPAFLGATTRLWLDGKGVYADVNLRGGGEYGAAWHDQGALTQKQNVFDDFTAAAQSLIAAKYTTPAHLAFMGGSNGGLLMGAMITQHPGLARAVVSMVGIYDMLRLEQDPNGLFNTTEYGSVKNQDQFRALYAYSPYQHVVDGTKYPAIFMATGEHDGRVNPAHSRKMIAALQAATGSGAPVLLSINSHAGHGIGSALSVRVDQETDVLTFLFGALGMGLPGQ
jgi:prolyl oligopeptidase